MDDKQKPNEMEKDLSAILGYGKEIEVAIGRDGESGEIKIEKFHMCPVSLKDIPELQKSLNVFFNSSDTAGKEIWNKETVEEMANVVLLSLRKMHPKVTTDEILDKFGLGGLAKAVKTALDINNFLSEMGEIQQGMAQVKKMPPA